MKHISFLNPLSKQYTYKTTQGKSFTASGKNTGVKVKTVYNALNHLLCENMTIKPAVVILLLRQNIQSKISGLATFMYNAVALGISWKHNQTFHHLRPYPLTYYLCPQTQDPIFCILLPDFLNLPLRYQIKMEFKVAFYLPFRLKMSFSNLVVKHYFACIRYFVFKSGRMVHSLLFQGLNCCEETP